MLKYQQFGDIKSDISGPKVLKCLCIDAHNNKNGQSLKKYQKKNDRYISLPFCFPKIQTA